MLRRENINLIQVAKEAGVVVNVMAEQKKRPYGLGRTLLGRRGNGSRLWHGTQHATFMC